MVSAFVPALTSLEDGIQAVRWNTPLLPKLLLVMIPYHRIETINECKKDWLKPLDECGDYYLLNSDLCIDTHGPTCS